jgi:hypothetical protein
VVIGRERLRQILHERGISFQRARTRREPGDPGRDAKLDRIEYVTSHYPGRCFAFDQFGPLSIRPGHGTCRAARRHPARLRVTYPAPTASAASRAATASAMTSCGVWSASAKAAAIPWPR